MANLNLKTADSISRSLDGILTPGRIDELAESGYVPHYLVDGKRYYVTREVMQWFKENFMQHRTGAPFPRLMVALTTPSQIAERIPVPLLAMQHLLRPIAFAGTSGIYFLIRGDRVVYIGQSVFVESRVHDHMSAKEFETALMFPAPKPDLDGLEAAFIRALRPELNGNKGPIGDAESTKRVTEMLGTAGG